jgi:hypothetical protein
MEKNINRDQPLSIWIKTIFIPVQLVSTRIRKHDSKLGIDIRKTELYNIMLRWLVPSINGYFAQSQRYAHILILAIFQYIHVVNPAWGGTRALTLNKMSHFRTDINDWILFFLCQENISSTLIIGIQKSG